MNNVIASKAKQSRLGTWDFLLERRDCFALLAMTCMCSQFIQDSYQIAGAASVSSLPEEEDMKLA
jgi:hypothetical protein